MYRFIVVLILSLMALSCSEGGGGIVGSGRTVIHPQVEGLIVGRVDGFGSIIINNKRFETDSTAVFVNGMTADIVDINVGMRVTARVNYQTEQAEELYYQPVVVGKIESYSEELSMLKILNQRILITMNTVLDELTPDSLVPDAVIEVSGARNSTGEIVAGYIKMVVEPEAFYTVGRVESTDEAGNVVVVSGTPVNYETALANTDEGEEGFTSMYLTPDDVVQTEFGEDYRDRDANCEDEIDEVDEVDGVEGIDSVDSLDCEIDAERVGNIDEPDYRDSDRVEVTGIIWRIDDDEYRVENFKISVSRDTEIRDENAERVTESALQEDLSVHVIGKSTRDRNVRATKITIIEDLR